MITIQHTKEGLSRAYVGAVASRAGVNLGAGRGFDYGFDGTFHAVEVYGNRHVESGFPLDFQCKASTKWALEAGEIIYDVEVKAYNDLCRRNAKTGAIPSLLLLLCLPADETQWATFNVSELILRECCYWAYLSGAESTNDHTVRIRIPVANRLTPDTLKVLLDTAAKGGTFS